MNLATKLNLLFFYNYVGQDEFGNMYYERRKKQKNILKRMVRYKGIDEASKIPSRYHGWLHYYSDEFPSIQNNNFKWQKKHLPNLTGTLYACQPKSLKVKNDNKKKDCDYKAWEPKELNSE